ncbi:MAG: hypothetical protein AAF512_21210 [Pseudomonadota bacterium]
MTLYVAMGIGMLLWALIPAINIYPFIHDDAVFTNKMIYDHVKIAMIDGIAREGLLPLDPYYAPGGERITLSYYYLWYFLASQIKLLTGVSGWETDVGCSYFTAFAVISFLSFLAVRLTQKAHAAIFVLLFGFCGMLDNIFRFLPQPQKAYLATTPKEHIETLWLQASWAPQHVFSSLSIIVLVFLLARMLVGTIQSVPHAVLLACVVATGFGASVWVGGIGLLLMSPLLLLTILSLRLPIERYFEIARFGLIALLTCIVIALPLAIAMTSGPESLAKSFEWPFVFYTYTTLNEHGMGGTFGWSFHVVMFWLKLLPVTLGIIYLAGMFSLVTRSGKYEDREEKIFLILSIATVIGYLLVVQFTKSAIKNNDLGWRSMLPPLMLLTVWGAVALTELAGVEKPSEKWRLNRFIDSWRKSITVFIIVSLTLGIFSTFKTLHIPAPKYKRPSPAELEQRQDFFKQPEMWAKVREYAAPTDLVQANPDAHRLLSTKPSMQPYSLLADRATPILNTDYSYVFSYRYDPAQRKRQYEQVRMAFSENSTKEAFLYLRDTLQIKVLLVNKLDGVWDSPVIDESLVYENVYAAEDYKVYRAISSDNQ